jgi:ADP-heptose:LPS heptosyltransferase
MKIVSFCRRVNLVIQSGPNKVTISQNPGERILLDDITAQILPTDPQTESVSDFAPYYANFVERPTKWRNKRVLFYRPRGIGDQLIASSLPRFFTDVLGAQCYQLADRVHESIWLGNPYIGGAPIAVPVSLDALVRFKSRPFYDYFFPLESVSEWDCEPEQENVYDRLFAMCGFYNVPDRFKTPVFQITPTDRNAWQEWIARVSLILGQNISESGYILYQMRATNIGRTVPLEQQALVLAELNESGFPILCVDDEPLKRPVAEMLAQFKNAHDVSGRIENVRLLGTMIANSRLTVAPDSLAIHFAAANQVPCLSVWGPFDPQSRIKYYPKQIGLAHPEKCPNAFCYNYMPMLPIHKCPKGEKQQACECYSGLQTAEIRTALETLSQAA